MSKLIGEIEDKTKICSYRHIKISEEKTNDNSEKEEFIKYVENPWSLETQEYVIRYCSDNGCWICTHSVDVYTNLMVKAYGYGGTPIESLIDCAGAIEKLKGVGK